MSTPSRGPIPMEFLDRAVRAFDDGENSYYDIAFDEPMGEDREAARLHAWCQAHGFTATEEDQLRGLSMRVFNAYRMGNLDYDDISWVPGVGEKSVRAYR